MGAHDNGGPAWPNAATATTAVFNGVERPAEVLHQPGMYLRDWFAGQALVSLGTWMPLHSGHSLSSDEAMTARADWAYAQADAMLAERAKAEGQS